MIPTHNPMLATLFGAKPSQSAQSAFAVQTGAQSTGGASVSPAASTAPSEVTATTTGGITVIDGNGIVTGERAEATIRKNQGIIARAREAEAQGVKDAAADLARGYQIQLDASLRGSHALAMRAPIGESSFDTRADAMEAASMFAGGTQSIITRQASDQTFLTMMKERLQNPEKWGMTAENIEMRIARTEDGLAADRLRLDIKAGQLRSMFGVTTPTYRESADSILSHVAYEVQHSQYGLLVSVDTNGTMTKYGPDGEPEVPMGQRLDRSV